MPIFEYRCTACDERFEELVRGDEAVDCPRCGARAAEKLLSGFAVSSGAREPAPMACGGAGPTLGACGTCGDPRGPGACGA